MISNQGLWALVLGTELRIAQPGLYWSLSSQQLVVSLMCLGSVHASGPELRVCDQFVDPSSLSRLAVLT